MAQLTDEEREVLELLGHAADKFSALPEEHPADLADFVNAIHAAQNIVLSRVGLRAYRASE